MGGTLPAPHTRQGMLHPFGGPPPGIAYVCGRLHDKKKRSNHFGVCEKVDYGWSFMSSIISSVDSVSGKTSTVLLLVKILSACCTFLYLFSI